MAKTSLSGPLYVGGKPVVRQDLTTGELVGEIPIVYPATAGGSLVLEGEFRDIMMQVGGPSVDAPRNVFFGPGGLSLTGVAEVAANGVITILKNAGIMVTTRLRMQRAGAAGVSVLVVWGERSIDGGLNWTPLPNVSTVAMTVATDITSFYDVIPAKVVIGEKYRIRFARSSAGNNSGDLVPEVLPGGLSFLGTVPSAYLSLYRFA